MTVSATVMGPTPFVLYESHASGQFSYGDQSYSVDLHRAHGLGIFYPPGSVTLNNSAYQDYIQHRLFDTTRDSGWTRFLQKGLPPTLGPTLPLTNNQLIRPLTLTPELYQLYLPIVRR